MAINAMYDTCNNVEERQVEIPFDLPYAIKGLLLQWDNEESSAGIGEVTHERSATTRPALEEGRKRG